MQKISLTQGQNAVVDDQDYEWLMQWKWCAQKSLRSFGAVWYATRLSPRPIRVKISMHREIARRANFPLSKQYDHRDGDGLHNWRDNIRPATTQQNAGNRRKIFGCSSRYKGVCWNKHVKKWMAFIQDNHKTTYLGYFIYEVDAAIAYDVEAQKRFGEFARLNFNL
jgi:hypothetical protein